MNRFAKWPLLFLIAVLSSSCASLKTAPLSNGEPKWLQESKGIESQLPGAELPPLRPTPANALALTVDQLPDQAPFPSDLTQRMLPPDTLSKPQSFFRPTSPATPSSPPMPSPQVSVVVNNMEAAPARPMPAADRAPLSRIEQLYNRSSGATGGRALRQYGYNQLRRPLQGQPRRRPFDRSASETKAETEPQLLDPGGPVDDDYLVGPGDEIILRITGALEMNERGIVQRDGTVFIPEVGAIPVAGTRVGELNQKLTQAVSGQYHPVTIDVALGRLHAIRIMVLGYAKEPGLYFLPANSTLRDALAMANGLQKDGSLRRVALQRAGEKEQTIDLYDLIRDESAPAALRLLSGDTIKVPAIGPTAAVTGPLLEGIYEILLGETLQDLAVYAGGITPFTRQTRVQLERTTTELKRDITMVQYAEEGASFLLADGDTAIFNEAYDRINASVSLEGRVISPGRYPFHDGMKISDLLRSGDGLLMDASLERLLLVRRFGERRNFDIKPNDAAGEIRSQLIWIDLPALLAGNPTSDLPLQRLDRLLVFAETDVRDDPQVNIIGAVRKPGSYRLTSGMRVRDLLHLAANTTADAYEGSSMLVRRSRATDGRHLDVQLIPFNLRQALQGVPAANFPLQNSDQVVIRRVQALQVRVDIKGRVHFPGTYILPDGATISDLMRAAGGLLPEADLRAAIFSRESVQQEETRQLADMQRRNREYFSRVRDRVTRDGYYNESAANQMALQGLGQLGANARKVQATGRIVLDLQQPDFPETRDDLTLESGDTLNIPRRKNTVAVLGRVFNPNAFICHEQQGLRVRDYLEMAGGLQDDADKKQFYVLLASGEVRSAAQDGRRKLFRYVPYPGDAILVPQEPLNRSLKSSTLDALMVVRQMAEIGMIGAAIPSVGDNVISTVGLETAAPQSGSSTTVQGSYEPMLNQSQGVQE